jgi:hypothetical protein
MTCGCANVRIGSCADERMCKYADVRDVQMVNLIEKRVLFCADNKEHQLFQKI